MPSVCVLSSYKRKHMNMHTQMYTVRCLLFLLTSQYEFEFPVPTVCSITAGLLGQKNCVHIAHNIRYSIDRSIYLIKLSLYRGMVSMLHCHHYSILVYVHTNTHHRQKGLERKTATHAHIMYAVHIVENCRVTHLNGVELCCRLCTFAVGCCFFKFSVPIQTVMNTHTHTLTHAEIFIFFSFFYWLYRSRQAHLFSQ